MDGNTARGASSPANPAFTRPEPLSHTRAVVSSSSHMVSVLKHTRGRVHARTQAVVLLVQVMEFPVCLDWLIGDIDFSQHTNTRKVAFCRKKKQGMLVSFTEIML